MTELQPLAESYAMHRCPWPGCGETLPGTLWGCRAHWHALPNNLRSWIGRAYRQGIEAGTHPSASYCAAHRAALQFIATEPGEHCGAVGPTAVLRQTPSANSIELKRTGANAIVRLFA